MIMKIFLKYILLLVFFTMLYGCSSGIKITYHEFDKSLLEKKDTVVVLTTTSCCGGNANRLTLYPNGRGVIEVSQTYGSNSSNRSNVTFQVESFSLLVKTFEMYDFYSLKDKYYDDPSDCPNRSFDADGYTLTLKINERIKSVSTGNCYGSAQVTKVLFLIELIKSIEPRSGML